MQRTTAWGPRLWSVDWPWRVERGLGPEAATWQTGGLSGDRVGASGKGGTGWSKGECHRTRLDSFRSPWAQENLSPRIQGDCSEPSAAVQRVGGTLHIQNQAAWLLIHPLPIPSDSDTQSSSFPGQCVLRPWAPPTETGASPFGSALSRVGNQLAFLLCFWNYAWPSVKMQVL